MYKNGLYTVVYNTCVFSSTISWDRALPSEAASFCDQLNLNVTFLPSPGRQDVRPDLLWQAVDACQPPSRSVPSVWRLDTETGGRSAFRTHSHRVCARDVPITWQETQRAWLWSPWQRDPQRCWTREVDVECLCFASTSPPQLLNSGTCSHTLPVICKIK